MRSGGGDASAPPPTAAASPKLGKESRCQEQHPAFRQRADEHPVSIAEDGVSLASEQAASSGVAALVGSIRDAHH